MFDESRTHSVPSVIPGLLFTLLGILSPLFLIFFGDRVYGLYGRRVQYFHLYLGLIFALIGLGFALRALLATRRAAQKGAVATTSFVLSLIVALCFIALTAVVIFDSISRGRNIFTGE